ncbi:hypothetical protein GEMRC1_003179 [Eukaryota sp. GEM-RC1]
MAIAVFYDDCERGIKPAVMASLPHNNPIVRKQVILKALSSFNLVFSPVDTPTDASALFKVHDEQYLSFLQSVFVNWKELGRDTDYCLPYAEGIVPYCFPANRHETAKIISKLPLLYSIGFYGQDRITPVFKYTWRMAYNSALLAIRAVDHLLSMPPHSSVFTLTTLPGHHAKRDRYAGYCFINNAIVAAQRCRDLNKTMAIIDVDLHAGDGTFSMAKDLMPDLMFISIHCDPRFEFPFYSGFEEENTDNLINYTLPPKTSCDVYMATLTKAIEKLKTVNADVIIVSLGEDTAQGDPDITENSGGFALTPNDFNQMGVMIRQSLDSHILILQEGGYDLKTNVPQCVNEFVKGMDQSC